MAERAESQQRIRDLEEETKVLRQGEREGNMEIDRQESGAGFNPAVFIYPRDQIFLSPRLKERLKKTSSQMKHDEEKRKTLQVIATVTKQVVCVMESPPKVSPLSAGRDGGRPAGGTGPAGAAGGQRALGRRSAQGAEGAGCPPGLHPHRAAPGPPAGGPAHAATVRGGPAPQGGARQLGPGERGI